MKKPKLINRRLACENRLFEVFLDKIEEPSGEMIEDYFVVAPKTRIKNMLTGVAILPTTQKGEIGLLKLYRHPLNEFCWEIPRGFIDEGEEETTSAMRELQEETGLTCERKNIHFLGFMTPDGGCYSARVPLFVALACKKSKNFSPSEFGHREFQLFSDKEMEKMIADSMIEDAATLVAYYRFKNFKTGR